MPPGGPFPDRPPERDNGGEVGPLSIVEAAVVDPARRMARGRELRSEVPRSEHAYWAPPTDRTDPVATVLAGDEGRLPRLVPLRHHRMAASPFAFYRGTADVMAADLASTPVTGLEAQLCGDAHLANFGTFASPERRQVFDVNDFDETLPGPWEWDVKRLATSVVLAARENGLDDAKSARLARAAVSAYAGAMARFAGEPTLDVWYAQAALDQLTSVAPRKEGRGVEELGIRARRRTSQRLADRLAEKADGRLRFRGDVPLMAPLRDLEALVDAARTHEAVETSWTSYLSSLSPERLRLLARFRLVDVALKVVGVGSVGTRCFAALLQADDHGEPLVLQVKEAGHSSLEAWLGPSPYDHQGERVVRGQRLLQTSSDIFLGWSSGGAGPQFYWRQMHDRKGSADTSKMDAPVLKAYAELCGWTLAHGHARSGDTISLAGYLGSGKSFAAAVATFALAYADQAERDHALFVAAIAGGRVAADDTPVRPPRP